MELYLYNDFGNLQFELVGHHPRRGDVRRSSASLWNYDKGGRNLEHHSETYGKCIIMLLECDIVVTIILHIALDGSMSSPPHKVRL